MESKITEDLGFKAVGGSKTHSSRGHGSMTSHWMQAKASGGSKGKN